jgi:hypothetical protein
MLSEKFEDHCTLLDAPEARPLKSTAIYIIVSLSEEDRSRSAL